MNKHKNSNDLYYVFCEIKIDFANIERLATIELFMMLQTM